MLKRQENGNRPGNRLLDAAMALRTDAARRVGVLLFSAVAVCGVVGGVATAAQAETRQPASSSRLIRRQARPGDTLWSMAQEATPQGGDVGETVSRIRRINHLDSSRLQVGQVVRVPRR